MLSTLRIFTFYSYIFSDFRLVKPRKQPYFDKDSAGMEDGEGAFERGLVKLKVPDTDVRAGGALV